MKRSILGSVVMVIVSVIAYFFANYVFNLPDSVYISYFGLALLVCGCLYLIYEVKNNFDFIYGGSQSGGSNANSYVVMGVGLGIYGWDLSVSYFTVACLITVAFAFGVAYVIRRKYAH